MRPVNISVVAVFRHSTSRENDPQLHSHMLLMNMTKTIDGWKATRNKVDINKIIEKVKKDVLS